MKRFPLISRRHFSDTSRVVLGIRREDPTRIWERRCPLTPDAVHDLIRSSGVEVLIQDCERRAFQTADFIAAGARVHDTLEPAHIVLGIKECPVPELLTSPVPPPNTSSPSAFTARTYLMFSHTIKGQPYNMGLLSKFLSSPAIREPHLLPRLVDYELLTKAGKRTVGFGWFAGISGALESLSALSQALLEQGIASPFLHTPRPYTLPNLDTIRPSFRSVGQVIAQYGTPKSLGPFVIGLTGRGNVANGVLSILSELPVVNVSVDALPELVANPEPDLSKVYVVQARPQDYFSRADGTYNREDYYVNPQLYHSTFHTKVAPYLTVFINAAGWTSEYPGLMTNEQLVVALERAQQIGRIHGNPHARFISVGDISCDIEGSLEFLTHSTTLSDPFFTSRPSILPPHLPGVQMMAVDILPAALPVDSSVHFSAVLVPYLKTLIKEYEVSGSGDPLGGEETQDALNRATIAKHGELTAKHAWLEENVQRWRETASSIGDISDSASIGAVQKKKVLILGSGMVAGPAIDEICKRKDVELIVGSNSLDEARRLTEKHGNATSLLVDVSDFNKVSSLIDRADVVISLLPAPFHPPIAELCIKQGKHMITASYISPAMEDLHLSALEADVLLLNEIGLDPGIDHCSAISLLEKLRADKKKIVSFTSFCGGLPAPESAENVPLGYKFSWSPRGVLGAALNGAMFKLGGQNWDIPGEKILESKFSHVPVSNVLKFEGIANRNSIPYADTYNLGKVEDLSTVLRGTLRYPGFCDLMHAFKAVGLLDTENKIKLESWPSLLSQTLEMRSGTPIRDSASLESALKDLLPSSSSVDSVLEALRFLSLSPVSLKTPTHSVPVPSALATPIDHFATLLAQRLQYEPHERDLVILSHEIIAQDPVSSQKEVHSSSLTTYGTSEASAMARCVGFPVALAALHVLDGKVTARGVQGPSAEKNIWAGVLNGLDEVGLGMRETVAICGNDTVTVESTLMKDLMN